MKYNPEGGRIPLANGFDLIWEKNEAGGRTYRTDEVGAVVWDTALIGQPELTAAMYVESLLRAKEQQDEK